LKARTQSGEVNADFRGSGDVDVETGSSAITLQGVRGGLAVRTQSGRVNVQGAPTRDWKATTGSSNVMFDLEATDGFVVDAVTRSSHIDIKGINVNGSVTKQTVKGTVGNGGPTVMVRTGNGQIHIVR